MRTVDRAHMCAPLERAYAAASEVERWPAILPHYRWVRRLDGGLVEMAAWRPFGPVRYPAWWVSEIDRKSTRLNSSHTVISYAVFCLKKKNRRLHLARRRSDIHRHRAGLDRRAAGLSRHAADRAKQ